MKLVFLLLAIVILIIVVRSITKNRNTQESQLGAFEHPSTFKKPPIEMLTKEPTKTVFSENNTTGKPDDAYDITKN